MKDKFGLVIYFILFFLFNRFHLQKYSSDTKRLYRHDRLMRGICMDWCKTQMKHFDDDTRKSYFTDNFYNDTDIYKNPNFHARALVDRARYYHYATECVNYELHKQYGLMAQSQIRYCITNKDNIQTIYGISKYNLTFSL